MVMEKTMFNIVRARVQSLPNDTLYAAKVDGEWKKTTAQEAWDQSSKLAYGLLNMGVANQILETEQQEKIAIISNNRPDWLMTDVAVQRCGAILTPIYPTISPDELIKIFNEAEIEKVFISGADQMSRFGEAFKSVSTLKHIFSFDKIEGAKYWKEIFQEGGSTTEPESRITASTTATIIYTSGTTGDPKGVILSHSNIVENVSDCRFLFGFLEGNGSALSFLPLNHIFEKMVSYIYIEVGLSIYYAESMETIGDNLREVKPVVFTTVPRLLEKVYERIMGKGTELKGIKKSLFFWALALAKKYDNAKPASFWYNWQLGLANRLIFSKWREALGGNVRAIVSGSAPLQERLIRIF